MIGLFAEFFTECQGCPACYLFKQPRKVSVVLVPQGKGYLLAVAIGIIKLFFSLRDHGLLQPVCYRKTGAGF